MKASAHGAERLRKIVNDAVKQDFFLQDFAEEAFVGEQGIARGLKPFLLLGEGGREIADDEDPFAVENQGGGFERR